MDAPILTGDGNPVAYECKFTVEGTNNAGGDFECNTGGLRANKRVTFEGYASRELYDALVKAIEKAVS